MAGKATILASSGVVVVKTKLPLAIPSSRAPHVSETILSHNANVDFHAVFEFKLSINDSTRFPMELSFSLESLS